MAPAINQATRINAKHLIGGIKFDRCMMFLISWYLGGLYLDGWAHVHLSRFETFLTPWHFVLYSGYFACGSAIIGACVINHLRGYSWEEAVPEGYMLSLLGLPLFAAGGVADFTWHILFGIEIGIAPLLSPPHLLLAFSGIFILSGPFRAAWCRSMVEAEFGWAKLCPMLLSVFTLYSVFTFFTAYAHPFLLTGLVTSSDDEIAVALGIASILLQSGIMIYFILSVVKRWRLPFGAITLLISLNAALMSVFADQYRLIPAAFIAGLVSDVLARFISTSPKHSQNTAIVRLFAFFVPFIFYLGYFVDLQIIDKVAWAIHLWLGVTIMSGVVGVALSYLQVPPEPMEMA